jgi:hypothetical protein
VIQELRGSFPGRSFYLWIGNKKYGGNYMFIILPVLLFGYGLLKAGETVTTKMVEKKNFETFLGYVQDNPRFVLVPQKIYDSPIRRDIAEGVLPVSEAQRKEEQEIALLRAKQILSLVPEKQLAHLLRA